MRLGLYKYLRQNLVRLKFYGLSIIAFGGLVIDAAFFQLAQLISRFGSIFRALCEHLRKQFFSSGGFALSQDLLRLLNLFR